MMGRISFLFVIVLLQMFQSSICVHAEELESLGFIRCKKHELDALLKFKQSFTKDPKKLLSSWIGEDCCQWHGVTCDNVTDNVVKLNLRSQPKYFFNDYLGYGYCLPNVSMVSSGVSSALLELEFLTHLDLSENNFSGSRIPEFIGSLRHLRYLNLSLAGFAGPLPPQLGNLTNLVQLDLNVEDGCLEQTLLDAEGFRWTSSLLKLQSLDMSGYNLSRAHDTIKVLMNLPALSDLSLFNCELHNSHLSEAFTRNTSNSFFPPLQYLDLGWNAFEGPFPSFLKNTVSLRHLSLFHNNFNGSVPLWLSAMKRLEILDLSYNGFSYVEGGIVGIMGNPCNFKTLDLSNNIISQGDILGSLVTRCGAFGLKNLGLSYNMINGSLPSLLGQFTNLSYLDLSYNEFKGQIPESFVNLLALTGLDLSFNHINGSFPSLMGQFTNLSKLDLSHNEFKGQIPAFLVNLSALKHLDLSYNNLSGLIPKFIGHLNQIEYLDISSNSLTGTFIGIGNLSKLTSLGMSFNNLHLNLDWRPPFQLLEFYAHSCVINAVFPQWLRNQTRLTFLDLSYTGISGELPKWLWNSSYISELYLSGNRLTGSLPQHEPCDCLSGAESLNLDDNLLSGTIPKWLSHLQYAAVIDLSSNRLTGPLFDGNNASSFFNIGYELDMLDLSDNLLSGEIQFGMESPTTTLDILSLRGNHFNGPIPSQLCNFRSLLVLDLARNRLTGHIPPCFGSMPFGVNDNCTFSLMSLQFKMIVKGIDEVYSGKAERQSVIDLSSNYLIGSIPEELTNISALYELNLSYNHLTGHIPEKIGNLKQLESLDLSNNHISGTIPQSLSSIKWLGKLNLSNNNLHGPIPTGRQLQTLDDASIYANNSGLCGSPLPNNCTEPDSLQRHAAGKDSVDKENKYDKMWFILAVMSGVATGFWGVVGTLVIKRSWRESYFRYLEDLADRIYVPIKVRMNRFKRRFGDNSQI